MPLVKPLGVGTWDQGSSIDLTWVLAGISPVIVLKQSYFDSDFQYFCSKILLRSNIFWKEAFLVFVAEVFVLFPFCIILGCLCVLFFWFLIMLLLAMSISNR